MNKDDAIIPRRVFVYLALSLSLIILSTTKLLAEETRWNTVQGGNWFDASRWSAEVPNGPDVDVRFPHNLPLPLPGASIRIDDFVQLRSFHVDNAGPLTLTGLGTVELVADTLHAPALYLAAPSAVLTLANPWRFTGDSPLSVEVAAQSTLSMTQSLRGLANNVEKTGEGTWELPGFSSNWSGQLQVAEGTVDLGLFGSLGGVGGLEQGVSVGNGAHLRIRGGTYPLEALEIRDGRLSVSTDAATFLSGDMHVEGNSAIVAEGTGLDVRIASTIRGSGDLELLGSGRFVLAGPSEHSGILRVAASTRIENTNALGTQLGTLADATFLGRGAEFRFAPGRDVSVSERFVLDGGTLFTPSDGTTMTITGPLDVISDSVLRIGSSPSRTILAGPLTGHADLLVDEAVVELASPTNLVGTIIVDGRVVLTHENAFGPDTWIDLREHSYLHVNAPTVAAFLAPVNGTIDATANVTVRQEEIRLAYGKLDFRDGASLNVPRIVQDGAGVSVVAQIGPDSPAELWIEHGYARVTSPSGLGTANTPTRIVQSRNAALEMREGVLFEDVYLNNATGFNYRGALIGSAGSIRGDLHLGEVGSILSGGSATLFLDGRIIGGDLTAINVTITGDEHPYSGRTMVGGHAFGRGHQTGDLVLAKAGRLASTSEVVIRQSGQLTFDRRESEQSDALADHIPVSIHGGVITFYPHPTMTSSETLGDVTLFPGEASIGFRSSGREFLAHEKRLILNSVTRETGSGLSFFNTYDAFGQPLGAENPMAPRIMIDALPPGQFDEMIGGWATVGLLAPMVDNSIRFAWYDPLRGVRAADPAQAVTELNEATATDHVLVSTAQVPLAENRTIRSLASDVTRQQFQLDLGGNVLDVLSGGILANRMQDDAIISNGVLTGGMGDRPELFFHVPVQLLVSAGIRDKGDIPLSVVKLQRGELTLSGENLYTGTTFVQGGTLRIADRESLPTASPIFVGGGDLAFHRMVGPAMETGPIHMTAGLVSGPCCAVEFEGIAPARLDLEAGAIQVSLAGNGTLTKTTSGRVDIESDSPSYTGRIEIVDGTLGAGAIGGSTFAYPLGQANVVVREPGALIVANRTLPNHLELHGGTLGTSNVFGRTELTGDVRAAGHVTFLAYDGSFIPGNQGDGRLRPRNLFFRGPVELDAGTRIEMLGSGKVEFASLVLQGDAILQAPEAAVAISDAIEVDSIAASLNLVLGPEPTVIAASVRLRNDATLSLRSHGQRSQLWLDHEARFVDGIGTLDANVAIHHGAFIAPGQVGTVGQLNVIGDLSFHEGSAIKLDLHNVLAEAGMGWDHLRVDGRLTVVEKLEIVVSVPEPALGDEPLNAAHFGLDPINSLVIPFAQATEIDVKPGTVQVVATSLLQAADIPSTARMDWDVVDETFRLIYRPSLPGDANLDGVFDSTDLVQIFQAGKYELATDPSAAWSEGDWNGDRQFSSGDLIVAFMTGAYEQPSAAISTVPEPGLSWLLLVPLLNSIRRLTYSDRK
jgi:autotransporter-associated beta strand protein